MYRHTSSRLRGPVSRNRICWKPSASESRKADKAAARLEFESSTEIRADLVARVRREIAEGAYDTPERWNAALERLLARLTRP